jgi:hypothetical protein
MLSPTIRALETHRGDSSTNAGATDKNAISVPAIVIIVLAVAVTLMVALAFMVALALILSRTAAANVDVNTLCSRRDDRDEKEENHHCDFSHWSPLTIDPPMSPKAISTDQRLDIE